MVAAVVSVVVVMVIVVILVLFDIVVIDIVFLNVGCSLKGSTASTIAYWDHFHIYIILNFREIAQIWGYLSGGNSINMLPYAHPQLFKVFKLLIYV